MKALLLLLVFLLPMVVNAQAPQAWPVLKLTTGKEYTDVKVSAVEATGLKVIHSTGFARIPFEQLPADLREHFKFDPAKAEAQRAQEAAMKKAEAEKAAEVRAAQVEADAKTATGTKPVTLWTRDDVLAVWLANCDPSRIPALDRDLAKKREAYAARAKGIRAGRYNSEAQIAANEANAKLLAEAGDSVGASAQRAEADTGKAALNARLKAQGDRERLNDLISTIVNGRPPLSSVGGGR